jgi:glucose-1-phosphatase
MIKTIIFDLGKVIVPFDFQRAYDRLAPLCSYPATEISKRIGSVDLVTRFECGQVEPEVFVKELSEVLELKVDYAEFCAIWSTIFHKETFIADSLLEALKMRYRLVLLSNTNAIHWEMIRGNYPLLKHFDQYILSFRVGALKPDPAIYRAAIEAAQCEPGECFFTDDIRDYVEGAKKHGIDAVQFQSSEQIQRELKSRGVEW